MTISTFLNIGFYPTIRKMIDRLIKTVVVSALGLGLVLASWPIAALAAGISPAGGGRFNVGQTFTITVKATGAQFDALQGTISVSGPVTIVSFGTGAATWLPGKAPANGAQFVGITSPTSALTVATIKLRGTKEGSGAVNVAGVRLARSGAQVGSAGGSVGFTISKAPVPPGAIKITSPTHPDSNLAYEATTIELTWEKPAGVSGFSTVYDDASETTPATKANTSEAATKIENQPIGVHYFHLRAQNADGWGPTAHFKITIKEPDPKINPALSAATITGVSKSATFTTDLTTGTSSGLVIKGTVPIGMSALLKVTPLDRLPAGLTTASAVSTDGAFEIVWELPILSGLYQITAQGQQEKVLTPESAPTTVEISVANGGSIKIITEADRPKLVADSAVMVLGVRFANPGQLYAAASALVVILLLAIGALTWAIIRSRRRHLHQPSPGKTTAASQALVKPSPGSEPTKSKFWNT